jgi:hypothetical protein
MIVVIFLLTLLVLILLIKIIEIDYLYLQEDYQDRLFIPAGRFNCMYPGLNTDYNDIYVGGGMTQYNAL